MEKLAYLLKDKYVNVKEFFASPKFLRVYDKVIKALKNIIPKIAIYAILICFAYIFMAPILRVLVDSFKVKDDIMNPDVVWIPTALTFTNYLNAGAGLWIVREAKGTDGIIISTLFNSTVYSLIPSLFQTLVACTAGYAFARFNFKGKGLWFAGLILAFILPSQLLTLPRAMLLNPLMKAVASPSALFGLIAETRQAYLIDAIFSVVSATPTLLLTLLGQGINSSIMIFISFSFFKMIPIALDEAAQIDGANFFQIFYHIIIKMSIPTILVVFLFAFIWNWNDTKVLDSLTFDSVGNLRFQTLPQSLDQFNYRHSQGQDEFGHIQGEDGNESNNAGLQSAAIIISILPLLILYAFTQRKFVEGIENTGVTGV